MKAILPIIALVALYFAWRKYRERHAGKQNQARQSPSPNNPVPNPAKPPADPNVPQPPPASPDVLIDRNGKRPGDDGYDPRVNRPADEFSPIEPRGAYYGEGPFDPDSRWVGSDGVHWTDKSGVHHGP